MNFRQAILNEMERQDLSRYRVVKMLDGRVAQTTVYQFLRGEHPISSDALGEIMNVVGLTIAPAANTPAAHPRTRKDA